MAWLIHAIAGVVIFMIGLHGLLRQPHMIRKVLALNYMGSGVFLLIVAMADRTAGAAPDPVPHALVLTGIVVSVSFTALLLVFADRVGQATGSLRLPEDTRDEETGA